MVCLACGTEFRLQYSSVVKKANGGVLVMTPCCGHLQNEPEVVGAMEINAQEVEGFQSGR